MTKTVQEKERVVIRFAGDSGDGMQLTGDRFTSATAVLGNDLATLPDFPAEIRAPAGRKPLPPPARVWGSAARPADPTLKWLERKFGGKQEILDANVAAFKAGYTFGETTELFAQSSRVKAAPAEPGTYRNIAGAT